MKRLIIITLAAVLLIGIVAWTVAGIPPVGMVWRYGFSYGPEPTGRTLRVEGVEFVEIGSGCFLMGSHHLCDGGSLLGKFSEPLGLPWGRRPTHGEPPVHAGKGYRECPIHWVQFEQPFWIARTPVVNQHYEAHAPEHKRGKYSPGDRHPVVYVSWQDAKVFCEWLVSKSGYSIRLPSESEWECACRAGSNGEFCYGDEEGLLPAYAWFKANSASAQEVATRKPNAWRLFDLHGNVHEYCEDGWHRDYEGAPRDGSVWEGGDTTRRVVRGGSWGIPGRLSRSAHRAGFTVEGGICTLGFRPAFAVPAKSE